MKKKGIIAIASTLTLAGVAAVSSIGIAVGSKKKTTDNQEEPSINQTLYTVTFNTNGGVMADAEQTVTGGNTLTAPVVTKAGYEFLGWYSDEACTQKFDFNATPISGNITLYAKWGNKYTVNFNTLGGSEVDSVRIAEGSQVAEPMAPTKTGFTFAGWFVDENCTNAYNFDAPVNAELNLYAKWNVITCNVTFDTCGYSELAAQRIYYGGKITEPSLYRNGYVIAGWYLDAEYHEKFDFDSRIESDIKLYAKWVVSIINDCTFELKYNSNSDDYYVLTNYSGTSNEITIPMFYGSSNDFVTAIGNNAFENCQTLTKVILTENINSIGDNAFDNCTNLETIDKLDTVNYIGSEAFKNCTNLTKIVIPSGVGFIGAGAFDGCENLVIYCEASTKPNGWDDDWLSGFNEDNVVWVGGVVDGDYAFKTIDGGSAYAVKAYLGESGDLVIPETCKGKPVTAIASQAFYQNWNIESVIMSDSINNIGNGAFEECGNLKSVKLSKNVTNIGEYVFSRTHLGRFVIPDTVTSISSSAFDYSSLRELYIPSSVVLIEECAFVGSELSCIYCESESKPDGWCEYVLYGESEDGLSWDMLDTRWGCEIYDGFIYSPINNGDAWEIGFYIGNSNVIKVPESYKGKPVISIADYAFSHADKAVNAVVIPACVTHIGCDGVARDGYYYGGNYNIYCVVTSVQPDWHHYWKDTSNVYFGNQWHYDENGNPVPNNNN